MSEFPVQVDLTLNDQLSAAMGAVQSSVAGLGDKFDQVDTKVKTTTQSFSDTAVQANSLALAGATLFMSFERIENSQVALDRANLNVQKSTNALTSATNAYNTAVAKYGVNSQEATDAAARLATAEDALTVAKERVGVAQNNLNNSMIYGALTVVPSFLTMSKALDISMKTLAIDAGAAFGGFAIGYTILESIPEPMRKTAAAVAVVSGALVAATIAAYAFWEGVSMGSATPLILAGIAAVGVAIAGVIVLMNNATSAADTYSTSLGGVAYHWQTLVTEENTAYQTDLTNMTTYWDTKLSLTETSLEKIESKIKTYYNNEITTAEASYQKQIDAVNAFYDQKEMLQSGTAELSANQQKTLDFYEYGYLKQKRALEAANRQGTLSDKDYHDQVTLLTENYNQTRQRVNETYWLQNYENEQQAKVDSISIEADRQTALTNIASQGNQSLIAIWQERNSALQTFYAQDEEALQKYMNNIAVILQTPLPPIFTGTSPPPGWAAASTSTLPEWVVPAAQGGGIFTEPTVALIGEAGPEAVVPLGRGEGYGAVTYHISIPITVEGSVDQRTLEVLRQELKNVVVEATSQGAPATQKRIRLGSSRF